MLAADTTSATLKAAATQCTGTATHAGIWLLHVTVSGQTIDVPVYVDATAGAETALGVAKLQLCLSDPYDNAPASQRAVFGAKIINAKLTLNTSVLTAPATGSFLWRSVITPWNTTAFAPDLAHTIEVQSPVLLPQTLSLSAKVKTIKHKHGKKTTVTNSVLLSGKLLENLQGVSGATVRATLKAPPGFTGQSTFIAQTDTQGNYRISGVTTVLGRSDSSWPMVFPSRARISSKRRLA